MTGKEKEIAKHLFATSAKGVDELFKTSDAQFFYKENDAKHHGRSLEDSSVEPIKRSQLEKKKPVKAPAKGATKPKAPASQEGKDQGGSDLKEAADK